MMKFPIDGKRKAMFQTTNQYCIITIYHIFFYHGTILGFKGFGYNQLRYYGDIMIPLWTAQGGSLRGTV